MRMMGAQTPTRTFWWDRGGPVDAEVQPLRAVIFNADSALADIECDDDLAPKAGLADLVMSLFVNGIWVAVVSTRDRDCAQMLVRHLIGEGLVETIVSRDDLDHPGDDAELYRLALWELGITPESALAFEGSDRGLRAANAAGLPALFVSNGYAAGDLGAQPLSAAGCRELHRRRSIEQGRRLAA